MTAAALSWHWLLHATAQQLVGLALLGGSGAYLRFMWINLNRMMDDL